MNKWRVSAALKPHLQRQRESPQAPPGPAGRQLNHVSSELGKIPGIAGFLSRLPREIISLGERAAERRFRRSASGHQYGSCPLWTSLKSQKCPYLLH